MLAYSDDDLASPFRSTVPLLAYWSEPDDRLPEFVSALEIDTPANVAYGFEYTVRPERGRGEASHTDLMIVSRAPAIAIEGKYTEPEYPTVKDWLGEPPTENKLMVLGSWLSNINQVTGARLQIADVRDCTYQLVHRTASACRAGKSRRAVVYQCFDPTKAKLEYYRKQLSCLATLVSRPEQLAFYLLAVPLIKSASYQRLQDAWIAGNRGFSVEVREGLIAGTLVDFGPHSIERF